MSAITETVAPMESKSSKRKREDEIAELEVDLNAAEPPSKKALRRAKKGKTSQSQEGTTAAQTEDESAGDSIALPKGGSGQSEKPSQSFVQARSQYGIWIGNLSFTTTKDDLMTFLTTDTDHPISKEEVTRVHLPPGQIRAGKPQNKGFAYIDFSSEIALNHGLQLSEKLLTGRRVLIKNAKSFEGRPTANKEEIASGKPPSRKIFVGNLAFDTTKEALEEHFGVCGSIVKVQVAAFEDSGKCKGYGWVEFEQLPAAQSAMRGWVEQGTSTSAKQSKRRIWLKQMNGRQLRMEFAEDPTTRYNKRFGKEAKKPGSNEDGEDQENGGAAVEPITEVTSEQADKKPRSSAKTSDQKSKPKYRKNGYEEETVKKLTGAITEGQGKKVVFD